MRLSLFPICVSLLMNSASGEDWPRYLGPDGAGKTTEAILPSWAEAEPKVLWTVEVGKGCAGFAISGGIAVTIGNTGKNDVVQAFDAASGKLLWSDTYEEPLSPKVYTGGPGATPTIVSDSLFTLSKTGRLMRYELKTGKVVWTKDLQKDFGGVEPDWGYSAAPVADDGKLLVAVNAKNGSLLALDPTNGEPIWKSEDTRKPGYGTPVIVKHNGRDAALVFFGRSLAAFDLENDGKLLFSIPWRTSYEVNASNPQYSEGKVFLASGYGMGYGVFDVTGAEPKKLHAEPDTRLIFQNSILEGDSLLAVFGDKNLPARLMRMDFTSGKIAWQAEIPGTRGSLIQAGETLLILSETGDLSVGRFDAKGFQPGGSMSILPQLCWAPLAVADGRIFARNNEGKAVCIELPKK